MDNYSDYNNPPFKPGTIVNKIDLSEKTIFVRVYDGTKNWSIS